MQPGDAIQISAPRERLPMMFWPHLQRRGDLLEFSGDELAVVRFADETLIIARKHLVLAKTRINHADGNNGSS
jgi:urease accessory protein UreE